MKKSKTLIIIGIVIAFFIGLFGLTYGYLKTQVLGNENASSVIVQMGDIDIIFADSPYINDTLEGPGWTTTKTFNITNNGSLPGTYSIYWQTLTNELINKADLTYTITSTSSGGTLSQTQIPNSGYDVSIIPNITINAGATQVYTMTLRYANTSSDQSSDMGKILSGKIKIESSYYTPQLPILADAIKMNEPVIRTVANDTMFSAVSNSAQTGLWLENRAGKTEDNLPTYFYRGATQNNYVSFSGKMWRIVRINEDGTIKLILGGNTTTDGYGGTTTFNPNYNLSIYVDYNHVTNALRIANEDWYSNDTKGNLDEYESYIADSKFCNDKSVASTSGSDIYYETRTRVISNKTPQFKCPNASDNYIYKIGALTADEVAYAGGLYGANNASYYLYDNAQSSGSQGFWWLLSPYRYYTNRARIVTVRGSDSPGYLNGYDTVDYTRSFRPVISLKADTLILSGNGYFGSPYRIT